MILTALHFGAALVAAAPAGEGGLKGALLTPDWALTIATWVTFFLLIGLLKKFGWGPFMKALEDRESRVAENTNRAEAARREAEELLKTYESRLAAAKDESDQIISSARDKAEAAAARILEDGRKAADDVMVKATQAIDAERQKAVAELHKIVADASVDLAEKIIRQELDPAKHRVLIESTVDEIKTGAGASAS